MSQSYHVHIELIEGELVIQDLEPVELTDDTSAIYAVRFLFAGVEDKIAQGYQPSLQFDSQPKEADKTLYSGPFQTLCHTPSSVVACGNNGWRGEFRYRATLENPSGGSLEPITSNEAVLVNHATVEKPAVVEVRRAPEGSLLLVEPQTVKVVPGQTIVWEVDEDLETTIEWYPRLVFGEGNPNFGPFRGVEKRDRSISATGAGDAEAPQSYSYAFQMVNLENGEIHFESSPDPTVDDEGDPPDLGA